MILLFKPKEMTQTPEVGQRVIVRLPGQPEPVEARVRAVLDTTEGVKLIVDFGHEQVATVPLRDVVRAE